MKFFISDTHLFHDNIRRYSNRPFPDIQTMNDVIVQNWNSVVGVNDEVYHLGDVGFAKPDVLAKLLYELNGRIYLIKGNHDKSALDNKCKGRFEWVKDYYKLKLTHNEINYIICMMHYPIARWDQMHYGSFHFFGHCHQNFKHEYGYSMDVGIDHPQFNYTPISLDQAIEYCQANCKPFKYDDQRI